MRSINPVVLMRRIQEHMQELYKMSSTVNKVLIVNREIRPNRITMILVKEEIGF